MNYHTRTKPQVPIYAEELETAYDAVRETFPNAVAQRISDFEVEFNNGPTLVAVLRKEGLKFSGKRGNFDGLFR